MTKKRIKDPKGGLTAAGRKHFKRKEGANLKPGVKGAANTPEKRRRKGSFLTRFYTNPSGPLKDKKGKPTRLALAARAWGESAPSTREQAQKLAAKGRRMLESYQASKKAKAARKSLEKIIIKENGGGAATSGSFGDGGGTVFTSTDSGIFNPTYGGGGSKRRRPHIRKPKKKKSGIERLDAFLREFSPVPKSVEKSKLTSDALIQLVDSVRKAEYPTRGYGGNLGRKQLDWKKPNSNEEPPKVSEFKGEINHEEDEQDESAVIEQKDMEQKIKNLDNEPRKEGRDQSSEDETISANTPDLVTLKGMSPSVDSSNPYKRGGVKDIIDDNPEIKKDDLDKFIDKYLTVDKEVGGATTQTTFQERDVIEEEEDEEEVVHPKGQKETYSTDE